MRDAAAAASSVDVAAVSVAEGIVVAFIAVDVNLMAVDMV
jgi:hypothetical protein